MRGHSRVRRLSAVCSSMLVLVLLVPLPGQGQSPEEFARRQYESGLTFLRNQKYSEALKDFQAVVDSYPTSSVADDALLEIARYHLEVAGNVQMAQTIVETLLKKYPNGDAAPMAHVMVGRMVLVRGRTPADIDTALASFERVSRLFPNSEAVPAAIFYAGEALRIARRWSEALERYRQVVTDYPRSVWSARALLGGGMCLALTGQPLRALEELQRVRVWFPGAPEASRALAWNTILYRLYVRPPTQPPYAFNGKSLVDARLKDVNAIAVDDHNTVFVGYKNGVAVFDPKGTLVRNIPGEDTKAVFIDRSGVAGLTLEGAVRTDGGQPLPLAVPEPDGKARQLEEIPAAVSLSTGDRLAVDRHARNVARFAATGKHIGPFASVNATRLAVNFLDDVAALDRESKVVMIFDREGRAIARIPFRGTGYELDNPVDLAWDAMGHLFILDRGRASILVFGPQGRLITTFSIPEKSPGAFQKATALGLDSAGRLFVYDERAERIQIYQ